MSKHRTSTDELHARIRELTEECRQLRRELETSTLERMSTRGMANDTPRPTAYRRRKPRAPK